LLTLRIWTYLLGGRRKARKHGVFTRDRRELRVASKDKGGKSEKKEPKKNLKEKRAAKKAKKTK